MDQLLAYSWPGTVRELENVIQRAITLNRGGRITTNDLPPTVLNHQQVAVVGSPAGYAQSDLPGPGSRLQTIDELERQHVIRALEETGGNRKRAAELLGINRRTLYRMAERFGIEF